MNKYIDICKYIFCEKLQEERMNNEFAIWNKKKKTKSLGKLKNENRLIKRKEIKKTKGKQETTFWKNKYMNKK